MADNRRESPVMQRDRPDQYTPLQVPLGRPASDHKPHLLQTQDSEAHLPALTMPGSFVTTHHPPRLTTRHGSDEQPPMAKRRTSADCGMGLTQAKLAGQTQGDLLLYIGLKPKQKPGRAPA